MSTIFHNPRCAKSREALAILREHGDDPTIIKYLESPPTVEELRSLIDAAGLRVHDAVRTREAEYQQLGLSTATPDDDLLAAMVAHPRLIERPIVVTDKGVRIPRPMTLLDDIL